MRKRKSTNAWAKFPAALPAKYYTDIKPIVSKLRRLMNEIVFAELPKWTKNEYVPDVSMDDAVTEKIGKTFHKLRVNYFGQEYPLDGDIKTIEFRNLVENQLVTTAASFAKFHKTRFSANQNFVIGVNPLQSEPWLKAYIKDWTAKNVLLIKNIPLVTIDEMQKTVIESVIKGESTTALRWKIQQNLGLAETRAQLIARDQTSKFYGTLTELRSKFNGWDFYEWNGVGPGGNERPDHLRLNNKIFRFSQPPVTVTTGKRAGERNNPGQDINCQCVPIIIFDRELIVQLVKQPDGSYAKPKQLAA